MQLDHHRVAVAVGDQTGKLVGLAVHQTHCVAALGGDLLAPARERGLDPFCEELRTGDLRFVEGPHAGANLRRGAVRRPGEEPPVGGAHAHGGAALRSGSDLFDRARKHPGMTPQERALPARLELELRVRTHVFQTHPVSPSSTPAPRSHRGWIRVVNTVAAVAAVTKKATTE